MSSANLSVAFLGIGNMGLPMAINLYKKGFAVTVFDLSPASLEEAKKQGLQAASSAFEAAKNADVVISMLPAAKHVKGLYMGPDGLLTKLSDFSKETNKRAVLVDCSTISPESATKIAQAATAMGFEFLDAPVSGGTGGAQAGLLTFMVGGPATTLSKAKPCFEAMGKNIFHAGEWGFGQVAKVCNNMLLAIHMIGTCEALALGTQFGMDAKVLSEIMAKSSGANWTLEKYNPYPGVQETSAATRGYTGGFASALMKKDLGLAMEAATSQGIHAELGEHAFTIYNEHCQNGFEGFDFSSVLKRFAKNL